MKRRVVVTGLGAVTPIGNTAEEFWNNAKERRPDLYEAYQRRINGGDDGL